MKKLALLTIMVSLILLSACAPIIVGGAVVSGISVANDRRSAGQVIDDKIISTQVRKAIKKAVSYDEHIKVMTYNGVVLLAGEADNESDILKAEDAAAARNGVVKVINELRESIPTNITRRTKDSYITSKAKSSLLRIKLEGFNPTRVRIMTTRGIVYLMGRVTEAEAEAVVEHIRNLRGVKKVVKVFEKM
ncbi:MAG: BON domain-containing protein [Alcanivoracaceae bacterium]|nr:BON domain-containing protein [Alcanivoracaceae bacterium]